jgi:hypothetical protein
VGYFTILERQKVLTRRFQFHYALFELIALFLIIAFLKKLNCSTKKKRFLFEIYCNFPPFSIFQLIVILVGQNDLCRLSCFTNSSQDPFPAGVQSPKDFARNVKLGLDKLMEELPKTLIALILPPGQLFSTNTIVKNSLKHNLLF